MIVPPLEQARTDYMFLTPDKYAFDFVTIVVPEGATTFLDSQPLGEDLCEITPADGLTEQERGSPTPSHWVHRCQLGFPAIDGTIDPPVISPSIQNDGVHRIVSNAPVFVAVTGWDAFVSYAYAGGTELREIAPPQ